MELKEFEKIEKEYLRERKRLESISRGDLIWDVVPREFDNDYHPAVVRSVNIDENYIGVIDVSQGNIKREIRGFLTADELKEFAGVSEQTIEEERKRYAGIIKKVKGGHASGV